MKNKDMTLSIISAIDSVHQVQEYDEDSGKLYLEKADYGEVALVNTDMFVKIFGKRKYQYINSRFSNKMPIVRIKYGKRSIYRRLELASKKNFVNNIIALTSKSVNELVNVLCDEDGTTRADKPTSGSQVIVTPSCSFLYFLHHPNSATRRSFRIGLPSLAISVASLILSFF